MKDNQIKIDIRIVDINELLHQQGLISHFEAIVNSTKVILDYEYKGEPNNGRVQLELSGSIGQKNLIDYYMLNKNVALPFQYPKLFELVNYKRDYIAVPHSEGIYILNINNKDKHIIKYQTNQFKTCFFTDNLFVLVEDKGCKIVNLADFKESSILFSNENRIFINAIKIQGNQIYAIILNSDSNQIKLYVFDKFNFSLDNYSEYNISELIETKNLTDILRFETTSKLAGISDFKYNSLIDSWRFVDNKKWNSLIGRIEHLYQPEKDGEYFIRKEKYDFIELKIESLANPNNV